MIKVSMESGPDLQFQAHLAAGRFMIQRGLESGQYVFFPRSVAPGTGEALEWVEASGYGTVYSATAIRKRPPEPAVSIVLVDLDEGPRMMSRVEGLDADAVPIGLRVRARITPHEEGHIIVFDPAAESSTENRP
ncbi:MAG: Zn-ribbon domain-containing OB-fold protein [Sphingomonadaceae bacterium]